MFAAWGRKQVEECIELLRSDEVDMTGEPESMALLREGRHLLVLKHRQEGNSAQCVFLSEFGSCTIHTLRPSPCRAYPYDRPSSSGDQGLGLHPTLLCPPETGVHSLVGLSRGDCQPAQKAEETVTRRDDEIERHAEWIAHWNRKQRTRLLLGRVPLDAVHFVHALLNEAETAVPST